MCQCLVHGVSSTETQGNFREMDETSNKTIASMLAEIDTEELREAMRKTHDVEAVIRAVLMTPGGNFTNSISNYYV